MDRAALTRLGGPDGSKIFAHLPEHYDSNAALRADTRLRAAGYPAELIASALTQWELRHRARSKFGPDAEHMFFTRDGLEQSTRAAVADLHAERFAHAGVRHIWDLGCGIGGDALAFRRAGLDVTAIDVDPVTATVAQFNLAAAASGGEGAVTVRTARIEEVLLELDSSTQGSTGTAETVPGVWLDPARRTPGVSDLGGRTRRIRSPLDTAPPWEVVLHAVRAVPAAGVKVGASYNAEHLEPGAQAQWISIDNRVVECVVWWGLAASLPGTRSVAVHRQGRWHHLSSNESSPHVSTGSVGETHPGQVAAGAYVCEVDPAVSAAGLRTQVAAAIGACELGRADYLFSPGPVDLPWARCWQIAEVLPMSDKALRAWAKRHDIGALTLKKPPSRSKSPLARLDPQALRNKIGARGSGSATLMLTEIDDNGNTAALWVRRLG